LEAAFCQKLMSNILGTSASGYETMNGLSNGPIPLYIIDFIVSWHDT